MDCLTPVVFMLVTVLWLRVPEIFPTDTLDFHIGQTALTDLYREEGVAAPN